MRAKKKMLAGLGVEEPAHKVISAIFIESLAKKAVEITELQKKRGKCFI